MSIKFCKYCNVEYSHDDTIGVKEFLCKDCLSTLYLYKDKLKKSFKLSKLEVVEGDYYIGSNKESIDPELVSCYLNKPKKKSEPVEVDLSENKWIRSLTENLDDNYKNELMNMFEHLKKSLKFKKYINVNRLLIEQRYVDPSVAIVFSQEDMDEYDSQGTELLMIILKSKYKSVIDLNSVDSSYSNNDKRVILVFGFNFSYI